jgi:DNA replication and repair protein RecF
MYVERLELVDFRNHPAVALELSPGPSMLTGPNGVGKTNVLEAIGYLATMGSHRPGPESSLVRVGAQAAIVRAAVAREGRTILVDVEIRPGAGTRARVNQAPVPRSREVLGIVRATLFAPEDLALVRGDPEERRRFLDTLAVQRLPRYLSIRQDYERVLRQRNTLLRSAGGRMPAGAGLATLDVWDEKLASAGGELWAARLGLIELIRGPVERSYQDLAARAEPVGMVYLSSVLSGDPGDPGDPDPRALGIAMRERLLADRPRELERGITLSGPHRDELALSVGDLPARTHASHGEAWSLALALRLGAHRLLADEGEEPILLLDDVFAELDRRRRERLAELALTVEQVIITASVPDELPPALKVTMFHVEPGSVERDSGS